MVLSYQIASFTPSEVTFPSLLCFVAQQAFAPKTSPSQQSFSRSPLIAQPSTQQSLSNFDPLLTRSSPDSTMINLWALHLKRRLEEFT